MILKQEGCLFRGKIILHCLFQVYTLCWTRNSKLYWVKANISQLDLIYIHSLGCVCFAHISDIHRGVVIVVMSRKGEKMPTTISLAVGFSYMLHEFHVLYKCVPHRSMSEIHWNISRFILKCASCRRY